MISQTGHEIDRYLLYALVSFGLAESILKLILWEAAQGGLYALCTLSALILLLNDIGILNNSPKAKINKEKKYIKHQYTIIAIESIFSLILIIQLISTGSRAAFLSLFSGILVIYTWIISPNKKILIYYVIIFLTFIITLLFLYYIRPESANGRILIWRVCIEMLHDKPLFGFGAGGFSKHYMNYQAEFLSANPGFRYAYLADDVFVLIMNYYISLSILGFLLL